MKDVVSAVLFAVTLALLALCAASINGCNEPYDGASMRGTYAISAETHAVTATLRRESSGYRVQIVRDGAFTNYGLPTNCSVVVSDETITGTSSTFEAVTDDCDTLGRNAGMSCVGPRRVTAWLRNNSDGSSGLTVRYAQQCGSIAYNVAIDLNGVR